MAFHNLRSINLKWKAVAVIALLMLTAVACSMSDLFATAFSSAESGA